MTDKESEIFNNDIDEDESYRETPASSAMELSSITETDYRWVMVNN